MELLQSTKPLTRGNVEGELIEDEMFLYDPIQDGAVHRLNSGAAVIWMLCDGSREVGEIAHEIATTYDLPQQEVLQQVKTAVEHFYTLGLLVPE